jgi:hypothetical protein
MIPKFSATCKAMRIIFHISNTDTLHGVDLAYFLSVIKYRKIFGEILLTEAVYSYYKKGNLELWLVLDLEVHVRN